MNAIVFEPRPYSDQASEIATFAAFTNPIPTVKDHEGYLSDIVDANHLSEIKNPYVLKKQPMNDIFVDESFANTPIR
jgi:hypothetical protein